MTEVNAARILIEENGKGRGEVSEEELLEAATTYLSSSLTTFLPAKYIRQARDIVAAVGSSK